MKDKNGIELCCENCRHYEYCDDKFFPDVAEGGEGCNFETSNKALEARIAELQAENALLKELRFTNEEIDFIKKAISMAILDCETNPPKPSDEKLEMMWSIKSKCDGLLR